MSAYSGSPRVPSSPHSRITSRSAAASAFHSGTTPSRLARRSGLPVRRAVRRVSFATKFRRSAMRRFHAVWPLLMSAGLITNAAAQSTGLPTFNAPYRAFTRSEIGVVLTFPDGGGTAFEGAYRKSSGKFDLGFRAGIFTPGGNGDSRLLLGAEARQRVVTHTEDF